MGDEIVQELDSGNGCITVSILKITDLYILKEFYYMWIISQKIKSIPQLSSF